MPRRYQILSNLDRARALGQLQAGQSSRQVAMAFNTCRQSIDRIRQRYAASGDVKDLSRSGRPRATNRAEDRLITNTTLRNSFTNAPTTTRRIRQQRGAGGIPVSVQTIRNRLHAAGLKSRVLLRSPVFLRGTEQLAFSLLVITSVGTGNRAERSRSQMKAGFLFDTLTGGYVSGVETGNVTQKSTCSHAMRIMEEASWSRQVWRRTGAPTSLLFQEYWPDNATSTRSYVLMWCLSYAQWATMASSKMTTQGCIEQELSTDFCKLNVRRLEWPAMSPDISCIEHVWDVLGRAVQKRMTEHSTMADLRLFPGEEWQRIPQATIRKLVFSTRKRLIECRDNQGGYTHY